MRGRVRLYVHDYMYCMHDGAMAGREQFCCCVFWTDWEACAGGRVGGRSVGRAVQLGWAGLPPRLSRLGRHSVGSVGTQVGWAAGPVLALALRSGGCHESLETQAATSGETGGKLECFLVAAWRRLDYHSLPLTNRHAQAGWRGLVLS